MALIRCIECNKEISDSAETCPHCGMKTNHGQKVAQDKKLAISVLFAFGFFILGMVLFISGSSFIKEYTSSYWGEYLWEEGYWTEDSEAVMAVIKQVAGAGMFIGGLIDIWITAYKFKNSSSPVTNSSSTPFKTISTAKNFTNSGSNGNYPTNQNASSNGWTCTCGKTHQAFVSSCSCGKNKRDIQQ